MIFQLVTHWFLWPEQGVVEEAITPCCRGRVKYAATTWPAELASSPGDIILSPQSMVLIVGRRGLVLLVKPMTV